LHATKAHQGRTGRCIDKRVGSPGARRGGILSPVSERGHEHIATSIHLDSASSETGILEEAVKIKPRLPLTLEEGIAGAAMIVLALITLANVIARYVLHASFAFTEEYSSVLLFGMVFVTASLATAKNNHIRMTFFNDRMSPRNQKMAANFGYVAIIVCFCVVIWYGSLMCWDAYKFGEIVTRSGTSDVALPDLVATSFASRGVPRGRRAHPAACGPYTLGDSRAAHSPFCLVSAAPGDGNADLCRSRSRGHAHDRYRGLSMSAVPRTSWARS
jgi:hypothetical protein